MICFFKGFQDTISDRWWWVSNHIRGKEQQNLHRSLHLVLSSWLADWFDRKAWFSTDYSFMTICSGFFPENTTCPFDCSWWIRAYFFRSSDFFRSSVWFRLKKLGAHFNRWWCSSLLGVRISWKWMTQKTRSANFDGRCRQVEVEWRTSQTHSAHLRRRKAVTWAGFGWLPGFGSELVANI